MGGTLGVKKLNQGPEGVFYCKAHFPRQGVANGPRGRSSLSHLRQVSVMGTRTAAPNTDLLSHQPPGTFSSLFRNILWLPLWATRAALQQVACALCTAGLHLSDDHREDCAYLYELLSVGLPLLSALWDVLGQMCAEVAPPSLQNLLLWAEL
ncbi:hypothetical protein Z043_110683 [Scleropages formosus]|uniref:Uncharacterized protein n=1 Tax=Scleropages formosus TaxID=113540 RepID=A0A0P7X7X1_SCLFO|nr:hypothetical protein Z043_110683 [Scleropages formosus]